MNVAYEKSTGDWYFAHFLAAYSASTLVALLAVLSTLTARSLEAIVLPVALRAFVGVGMFVTLWLWIRMLIDYFRERPTRHAVLWGWVLVLFSVVGSIFYFWSVWRPRHRPRST